MDEHLAARDFLVGTHLTLADVALYAYTHVADQGGFEVGAYPNVRKWLERVTAQPGYVGMDA